MHWRWHRKTDMKQLVCIVFFVGMISADAQHSKFIFSYDQKSNYTIDDDGVHADTLLFMIDFPELKFTKKANGDAVVGFVSWTDFTPGHKKRLASIIYHQNQIWQGEHDIAKNITTIDVVRWNETLRSQFRKYFGGGYSRFKYRIVIDYNKRELLHDFPSVDYRFAFSEKSKRVAFFDESKKSGKYSLVHGRVNYENIVDFDESIDKKITPAELFTNSESGVKEIRSVNQTFTLTSYQYQ